MIGFYSLKLIMEYESDESYDSDVEVYKPRLNMEHGFIHHIRRNQVDRDNYDKQVKQSNQNRKKSGSRTSKAPTAKLYIPPSQRKTNDDDETPTTKSTRNAGLKNEKVSQKLYVPPNQRKKSENKENVRVKPNRNADEEQKETTKQLYDPTSDLTTRGAAIEHKPQKSRGGREKRDKKQKPPDDDREEYNRKSTKTSSKRREHSKQQLYDPKEDNDFEPFDDKAQYTLGGRGKPTPKQLYDPNEPKSDVYESTDDRLQSSRGYRPNTGSRKLYDPASDDKPETYKPKQQDSSDRRSHHSNKQLYDPASGTLSDSWTQKSEGGRGHRRNHRKQLYDPDTDSISDEWTKAAGDQPNSTRAFSGQQSRKQLYDPAATKRGEKDREVDKGKLTKAKGGSVQRPKQLCTPHPYTKAGAWDERMPAISLLDNSWLWGEEKRQLLRRPEQAKSSDGGEASGGKALYNLEYTDEEGIVHTVLVREFDNPKVLAERLQHNAKIPPMYLETLEWKIREEQIKYGD